MPRSFADIPEYDCLRRLGRGAHATIYLARHRTTRRELAIKHIYRRGPEDDKFLQQAETEFEVSSKLDHPHLRRCLEIVRVRRWLKTRELFLIMEFCDGETLEQLCKRGPDGAVPALADRDLDTLVSYFTHIAEGLHALHRMGFAHADMKPNNVMIGPDGTLKIIDFGQSCPLGHAKERVQGTPDYIAPEQVRRESIDQRTDVFNLGATMYWTVTGKAFKTILPMAATGTKKITLEARRGNQPPHELNPRLPTALSKLILDCCETRPADRPRDMAELIGRLEMVQHLLTRHRAGTIANAPADSAKARHREA